MGKAPLCVQSHLGNGRPRLLTTQDDNREPNSSGTQEPIKSSIVDNNQIHDSQENTFKRQGNNCTNVRQLLRLDCVLHTRCSSPGVFIRRSVWIGGLDFGVVLSREGCYGQSCTFDVFERPSSLGG